MPQILENAKAFETTISSPKLSVIHFAADFAEQCKHVDDLLDTLSKQSEFSQVTFAKCQAEDIADISMKYEIVAVPTVILYRSGSKVDRINGADPAQITAKVKEHGISDDGDDENDLEERLKALINKAKVMLFMKGDRKTPKCGFSRTIIEILNSTGVYYETFDILTDEEVRQGLKTFSDWPTYPQLYVNGELIGGLDIIKEIQSAGELEQTLNA